MWMQGLDVYSGNLAIKTLAGLYRVFINCFLNMNVYCPVRYKSVIGTWECEKEKKHRQSFSKYRHFSWQWQKVNLSYFGLLSGMSEDPQKKYLNPLQKAAIICNLGTVRNKKLFFWASFSGVARPYWLSFSHEHTRYLSRKQPASTRAASPGGTEQEQGDTGRAAAGLGGFGNSRCHCPRGTQLLWVAGPVSPPGSPGCV